MKRLFVCGVCLLVALPFALHAQTAIPNICNDDIAGKTEAQLQADLALCNAEIARWQAVLSSTRDRVDTIDNDVQALTAKIKSAEATIKSKNIAISQLSSDISLRSAKIKGLESRVAESRSSLAKLIRDTSRVDDNSLAEVLLSSQNFSDFFTDVEQYRAVQEAIGEHLHDLRQNISWTETEKEKLGDIQRQELDAKYDIEVKKKGIAASEREQRQLLAATKQQATNYEQIVADRQAKANQINAALFRLRGIDGGGIPFKDALAYAKTASAKTGVRAAFILGILRQESNLGVNVGQCLLVSAVTGDGKGKNTGTPFPGLMKVDRDVPYFLDIMKRLGRDPYNTPVSCSQPGGYGGAMGPTQFIPSTWQGYETRINGALGSAAADPWNPQHAIMATALFLQDLGAARGGYSAEREAAGRYYAGGGWATRGLGYADSVLNHALSYQDDIDFLDNR